MPLLSEIARITGGRIITKDAYKTEGTEEYTLFENGKFLKRFSSKEEGVKEKEKLEKENPEKKYSSHYMDSTKDSVLSDLVGLAKKAGEALMEPTERAAAGDTKDGEGLVEEYNEGGWKIMKREVPEENIQEFFLYKDGTKIGTFSSYSSARGHIKRTSLG